MSIWDRHVFNDKYDFSIGRCDGTFIGIEDHGIPSFNMHFDFGGSVQGLGHYSMGHTVRNKEYVETSRCYQSAAVIYELVRRFGPWEQLKGKDFRVLYEKGDTGLCSRIRGLAGLYDDDAIIFEDYFNACEHSKPSMHP